ncbi:Oligosaccharide flippase family protein [Caballeronia sp. S22]
MARAGLGLTIGYGISVAGGVFSLIAYAHTLGPNTYGKLAVYLALVEAFQGIVFQWHRLAFVRYWTASSAEDRDNYLATSHIVWLVLAIAALSVMTFALLFANDSRQEWLAVAVLALTKSAALYTQEIARAASAVGRYALASLLLNVGATAAGLLTWSGTRSMTQTLYATAAVFALQTILCGIDKVSVVRSARFSADLLCRMVQYGLPLVPVFTATTVMTRLDRPILALFENPAVVGVYAASSGLVSNAVSAICLLVVTPCYPWLLREQASRTAVDHRTLHARLGLLMMTGVFTLCLALLLIRKYALPLTLGRSIGDAAQPLVLPLLAVATIAAFRTHFFDQAYHLHARTKALMGINLLMLLVGTLATYLGARVGGCEGVVYGLLVANALSLCTSAAFSRRFVDLNRITIGITVLSAFAALSFLFGSVARHLLVHIVNDETWATCLTAVIACALFIALCAIGNVGSVREVLKGKL